MYFLDYRAGLATFLSSLYIVFLIPQLLPVSPDAQAAIVTTALVCGGLTYVFALTRLPYMIGPGIVPASICLAFLADGVPWATVLGICLVAGSLFSLLAAVGLVKQAADAMPNVLKTVIQFSIGLYLFVAAVRAGGLVPHDGRLPIDKIGIVFLVGLVVALALDALGRTKHYAILGGIIAGTTMALSLGVVALPHQVFAVSRLKGLTSPDVRAALAWEHVVRILVMLYVLVVDVVATIETIARSSRVLQTEEGKPLNYQSALVMSGFASMAGPLFGLCPCIPFFETLAGTYSGGTTWRVSTTVASLFGLAAYAAPLATIVPGSASAVALAIIGLSIAKFSWLGFDTDSGNGRYDRVARYLIIASLVGVLYVGSLAFAVLATAAVYPVALVKAKQKPSTSDWIVASVCGALLILN